MPVLYFVRWLRGCVRVTADPELGSGGQFSQLFDGQVELGAVCRNWAGPH